MIISSLYTWYITSQNSLYSYNEETPIVKVRICCTKIGNCIAGITVDSPSRLVTRNFQGVWGRGVTSSRDKQNFKFKSHSSNRTLTVIEPIWFFQRGFTRTPRTHLATGLPSLWCYGAQYIYLWFVFKRKLYLCYFFRYSNLVTSWHRPTFSLIHLQS